MQIQDTRLKYRNGKEIRRESAIRWFALYFCAAEAVKQSYLYFFYDPGVYDVWYFPFQLCSMPIYLCAIYSRVKEPCRKVIATFLQDYGMVGGILALMYHEGFTDQGSLLLALHGYSWHIVMLVLAMWIFGRGLSGETWRDFGHATLLFGILAGIAECINVLLHGYGDCDMFYITPYHLSSQPFFRSVDAALGRPLGIAVYLGCIVFGAWIMHLLSRMVWKTRRMEAY